MRLTEGHQPQIADRAPELLEHDATLRHPTLEHLGHVQRHVGVDRTRVRVPTRHHPNDPRSDDDLGAIRQLLVAPQRPLRPRRTSTREETDQSQCKAPQGSLHEASGPAPRRGSVRHEETSPRDNLGRDLACGQQPSSGSARRDGHGEPTAASTLDARRTEEMAEAPGNRTQRGRLPAPPIRFEVREGPDSLAPFLAPHTRD